MLDNAKYKRNRIGKAADIYKYICTCTFFFQKWQISPVAIVYPL